MCEVCDRMAEKIRKEQNLPKGAPVPLLFLCPNPRYKITC